MRNYRLYILNNAGRFARVVELEAANDGEAIAAAAARRDAASKELWERGRLVRKFESAEAQEA